jgi:membrane associated rhomboid family serine protease
MWLYGVDIRHPQPQDIIQFGGTARPLIKEGQYWRLISGLFVHESIIVFLATILHLFILGVWFEKYIGKDKNTACFTLPQEWLRAWQEFIFKPFPRGPCCRWPRCCAGM